MKIGTPDVKRRFRRCGIAVDVPFRLRGAVLIAVAAVNAAAHQDHALDLLECGGVLADGGGQVSFRADGDDGDLAGMLADLAENELHSIGVLAGGLPLGIGGLGEDVVVGSGYAGRDRDCLAAHGRQVTVHQAGAQFRVAEFRGDAENLQFRALEGQRQGKRVVDVVADIGVDDGQLGRTGLRRGWPAREGGKSECTEEAEMQ